MPEHLLSQLDLAGQSKGRHSLSAVWHLMAATSSRLCTETSATKACKMEEFPKCHAASRPVEKQQQTQQSPETYWRASCILMGQA